ncbi:efflux RND transporter periplasmic adaptor subunit [Tropicimonas sp. IMCC34043]|uniref:efflux RND transporter periplasmic adaptor subunit n=1 Tax=Tropicimonas sp. IMCC34043 TaxID=2248760 RepID=UPI000E268A49|nr:efflux RND transporter periplasmic adaptor subunit [Tropicimonas sp. IMCC34043]
MISERSRPAVVGLAGLVSVLLAIAAPLVAETLTLAPTEVTAWKAVYGRVQAKDTVPARARIGGVLVDLAVREGESVTEGQHIATVQDEKLAFEIAALDAQMRAIQAQLDTAQTELQRGQSLVARGVVTSQRLDELRTDVDVSTNDLASTKAQREVVVQRSSEGEVLAPGDGRVLNVPVTRGAVVLAGETVATIGGGGFFLRIALPERHAEALREGAEIHINANGAESTGTIVKLYPEIEEGRAIADVAVDNLATDFVGLRVLVQVPVGTREALIVPRRALATRSGLDFITILQNGKPVERTVIVADVPDPDQIEVLTGLVPGDEVVLP